TDRGPDRRRRRDLRERRSGHQQQAGRRPSPRKMRTHRRAEGGTAIHRPARVVCGNFARQTVHRLTSAGDLPFRSRQLMVTRNVTVAVAPVAMVGTVTATLVTGVPFAWPPSPSDASVRPL